MPASSSSRNPGGRFHRYRYGSRTTGSSTNHRSSSASTSRTRCTCRRMPSITSPGSRSSPRRSAHQRTAGSSSRPTSNSSTTSVPPGRTSAASRRHDFVERLDVVQRQHGDGGIEAGGRLVELVQRDALDAVVSASGDRHGSYWRAARPAPRRRATWPPARRSPGPELSSTPYGGRPVSRPARRNPRTSRRISPRPCESSTRPAAGILPVPALRPDASTWGASWRALAEVREQYGTSARARGRGPHPWAGRRGRPRAASRGCGRRSDAAGGHGRRATRAVAPEHGAPTAVAHRGADEL